MRQHLANLAHPDEGVSARAEVWLCRHYARQAVADLIPLCASESPVVRFRAAYILGISKDPAALDVLARLTNDTDNRVRYDATLALGTLGDLKALGLLCTLLNVSDPEYCRDSAAAMALARLGSPALEFLSQRLDTMTQNGRSLTANIAAQMGGGLALQVIQRLCVDTDETVRVSALEALSELAESQGAA